MKSKSFVIGTVAHVKDFVHVTEKFIEDIDLVKGRYVVDGKSIMGIFSLDLSQPVDVCIYTEDDNRADEFFKEVEKALRG